MQIKIYQNLNIFNQNINNFTTIFEEEILKKNHLEQKLNNLQNESQSFPLMGNYAQNQNHNQNYSQNQNQNYNAQNQNYNQNHIFNPLNLNNNNNNILTNENNNNNLQITLNRSKINYKKL